MDPRVLTYEYIDLKPSVRGITLTETSDCYFDTAYRMSCK